jgi:hypothetical protein
MIDWRKSCWVPNGMFQRLYYGESAEEYNAGLAAVGLPPVARPVRREWLEDAGKGRTAGPYYEAPPVRYFFTQSLGRRDAEAQEAARRGEIRR